ncbi:MAG: cell division protein FtsQ/DivIB [Mariprofundaceae bacterium]
MSRANTRRIAKVEVQQRRRVLRRRFALTSGTILATALSLSTLFVLNQTFSVSKWEIETGGNAPVSLERQIDTVMNELPDYDFWSTRPGLLRSHLLETVSDLENIHIQRTLAGSLHLRAVARSPIGLWQKQDGKIFLVDMHGTIYRPLQATEMADLPILRINKADIHEASAMLKSMRSDQPTHFSRISELFANHSSWKINFNQGQQWMLSRNQNRSDSINRVSALLEKQRWRSGHWRVDARTANRWFIRPAKQEGVI